MLIMKNNTWTIILLVICLAGYGMFIWQYARSKKLQKEALAQVQREVDLIIAQRDSIESTKQITLDNLKQDKLELEKLILEMEKTNKPNITLEDAKKKLNSL